MLLPSQLLPSILFLLAPSVRALADSPLPPAPPLQPPVGSSNLQSPFFAPEIERALDRGDKVVRLEWEDAAEAEAVLQRIEALGLDVWGRSRKSVDVRVSAASEALLTVPSNARTVAVLPKMSTLIPSISDVLSRPTISTSYNLLHSSSALSNLSSTNLADAQMLHDPIHLSYHPYDSIIAILRKMETDFEGMASMVSFGLSSEGREIWGIKITGKREEDGTPDGTPGGEEGGAEEESAECVTDDFEIKGRRKGRKGKGKKCDKKQGFVVVGAQHAREWIAPATALYLAHKLLLSASGGGREGKLLERLEFTFVPVVNVDGYAYTWDSDRLWRKNRQDVGDGCFGIDLNRNWPYQWDGGNRPNPCSDAYPGSKSFQAPELAALGSYIQNSTNAIAGFLDLHSFGQLLMFPWSFSCDSPSPDEEDQYEAAVGAAKAIRAVHGQVYEVGSTCGIRWTAAGESIDWTYAVAKVRWSFEASLRDRGGVFGFLLPATQIIPSGEETSAALVSLAEFVLAKSGRGR